MYRYVLPSNGNAWIHTRRERLKLYVPLCTAKQWKCLDTYQEGEPQTLCTAMYCQAMEMLGYIPGGRGSNSMYRYVLPSNGNAWIHTRRERLKLYVPLCTAKQWKCLDTYQEGEPQTLCTAMYCQAMEMLGYIPGGRASNSMYRYVLPSNGNAWIHTRRESLKLYVPLCTAKQWKCLDTYQEGEPQTLCTSMYCQAMEMLGYIPGGRASNSMYRYVLPSNGNAWIHTRRERLKLYVPLCTAKQWKCLDTYQEGEAQTLCTAMYCQAMEMLGYIPGGRGSNSVYRYVLPSNGNAWIHTRRERLKLCVPLCTAKQWKCLDICQEGEQTLCSMYYDVLPSNGNAWIYARRERLKLCVLCNVMYCQSMEMLGYMPGERGSNSMYRYVLPINGNAWIYARRGRLKLYVLCTPMYCQAMDMLGYMPGGRGSNSYVLCTTMYCQAMEMLRYMPGGGGSNSMFYVPLCTAKQWKCLDICQEGEAQTLCSMYHYVLPSNGNA